MQNHFELFQLPQAFELNLEQLDQAYREVQNRVHPDKFVNATEAEQRVAMQWSTQANEAYQVLKQTLRRARYLCELQGLDLGIESNTQMPGSFLMQQMEWREQFAEARANQDEAQMLALEHEVRQHLKQLLANLNALFIAEAWQEIVAQVRMGLFLEKFLADIAAQLD